MAKSPANSPVAVDRRNFLKSAAGGAAALTASTTTTAPAQAQDARPVRPVAAVAAKEVDPPSAVEVLTADRPGSRAPTSR